VSYGKGGFVADVRYKIIVFKNFYCKSDVSKFSINSKRGYMAQEQEEKKEVKLANADRIRIKLKSYDNTLLDQAVAKIIDAAKRTGALISGPILLPRNIRKYTVNRSVHVDKKSREQFEIRIHSRLIDIINPTPKTADALNSVDLPSGVNAELKL